MGDSQRSRWWLRLPNLNKLFPWFGIRLKLGIAFALIALVPLAVASAVGVWVTANQMETATRTSLETGLAQVAVNFAHGLDDAQHRVETLADNIMRPLLSDTSARQRREAGRFIGSFLARSSDVFRVKLVNEEGRVVYLAGKAGSATPGQAERESGHYEEWRADVAAGSNLEMFPVDLPDEAGRMAPPAIAVLVPLRDREGTFLGAVIGEAYISTLLTGVEVGSVHGETVTGIVDRDGTYLYHSLHKRGWTVVSPENERANLRSEFPGPIVSEILSGGAGTVSTADGRIVRYGPMMLNPAFPSPFTVYRTVPQVSLAAPIRRFLLSSAAAGIPVIILVLLAAAVAAEQFTRPIYQLREMARRLAGGEADVELTVASNDELEDLARDFTLMATALQQHRQGLEALVAQRTRELGAAHAELSEILYHSADAIISVDTEDRIRVWNQGAERLFGYEAEEAIGSEVTSLIGPRGNGGEREIAYIRRELARRGALVDFRTERRPREGGAIPVRLTQTLLTDDAGRPLGSSLIIRDSRMEDRLSAQMRRSERLAAVNVMAAGLAHELNNPVAIILNRIECMQEDAHERSGDEQLERDLDVLREHVVRLAGVTTDLLRFAREDEDEPTVFDPGAMTSRIITLLEATFVRRGLMLQYAAPDSIPGILGYEKAVETVLVNLLLNAADATPAGGTISVSLRSLADIDAVELSVADTGPGIPEALREQIFEPFFTTKSRQGGTGLGLTVCQSIVHRHGGVIELADVAEEGSRFAVTLPRDPFKANPQGDDEALEGRPVPDLLS